MTQYSLGFVNEGKSFEIPRWTVKKHEELLKEMIPFDEQVKLGVLTKVNYDKIFHMKMILSSLHEIDKNVTEQQISELHPDDFMELIYAVYNSGKKGIVINNNVDFRQGEKKPL